MSASNLGVNNATRTDTFRPQYDPAPQLTTLQLGFGATRKMGYDSRGYLTTMIDSGSSGAISTIVDTYDSAGRKTKQVRDGVTSTYTMDNDDRLTLENRSGNLSSFAYDQDRNLTLLHNHGQNAVTMSHNALGQVVTSIAGSVVTTNTWDNAGRKTLANAGGALTTFGWDQENRMTSRVVTGSTLSFVYDEANHLRYRHEPGEDTAGALSYNYLDDNTFTVYSDLFGTRSEQMTPLEGVNVGNDDLDFLLDPLGSVIGKTSSSGVEDLAAFFPYGEFRIGTRPVSDLWAFVGSLGYRRFDDTLYDVWNRWLETNAGHWKSLDPIWPDELSYMYVEGMPHMAVDPTGLIKFENCSKEFQSEMKRYCSKLKSATSAQILAIDKCVKRAAKASDQSCQSFDKSRLNCLKSFCDTRTIRCAKKEPGDNRAGYCPGFTGPVDSPKGPVGDIVVHTPYTNQSNYYSYISNLTGVSAGVVVALHEMAHACGVGHGRYGASHCDCNDIHACCIHRILGGNSPEKCISTMKKFYGKYKC